VSSARRGAASPGRTAGSANLLVISRQGGTRNTHHTATAMAPKRSQRQADRRGRLAQLFRLGRSGDTTPAVFNAELAETRSQFGLPTHPSGLPYSLRAGIDLAVSVPGHGVFLAGWLVDPGTRTTGMFVQVLGGGTSENFAAKIERVPRDDVTVKYGHPLALGNQHQPGFLTFVQIPNLPEKTVDASLILRTSYGEFAPASFLIQGGVDAVYAVKSIIGHLPVDSQSLLQVLEKLVGPVVEALWSTRQTSNPHVSVKTYGPQVEKPRWTVIVPLYKRYDFIRYQLSQFADDPDFREAELLYVVDDPEILDRVLVECVGIQPIFGIPFKVLYSGFNLGYAGANNLGAAHSHAATLVLLNSDVLPAHSGWLGRLDQQRQVLPNPGAVGPKLLYEDGSIQHAGISFARHPLHEELWINEHLGKGQLDWIFPGKEPVRVAAVTGACMMLDRSLYENVGGLDEGFILGDFEDSDLCLKLIQVGRTNYYVPNVELYHLERQSDHFEGGDHRTPQTTIYNCWRHSRKWDSQIKKIIEQFND